MTNIIDILTDKRTRLQADFAQRDSAIAHALQKALAEVEANAELESSRLERQERESAKVEAATALDAAVADLDAQGIAPLAAQAQGIHTDIRTAYATLSNAPAKLRVLWGSLLQVATEIGKLSHRHSAAFADDQQRRAWIDNQLAEVVYPLAVLLTVGADTLPEPARGAFHFMSYAGMNALNSLRQVAQTQRREV